MFNSAFKIRVALNEKFDNLINSDAYLKHILTQIIFNTNFDSKSLHFNSEKNKCYERVIRGYIYCSYHYNNNLKENINQWFDSKKTKIFNDYLDSEKIIDKKRESYIKKYNYIFSSKKKECQDHNNFIIKENPEIENSNSNSNLNLNSIIKHNLLKNKIIKYICYFVIFSIIKK